ncbi:hypothetical protein PV08_08320 [Exophiala spinifera]|uniref:Uncharacterized protein n=1 Tax=Exophiala spinifera TaxID=91928 RepID=A0A0D2B2J2_9EURO|nr:uncharacterized protein PV08_08320 [Exophiala spinifera]KIW13133.1 hypothetical protein PV08_08320 [Exophiala spinifera]
MSSYQCTLYDASAPLLSQTFRPSAASFPQSGSISWVNLIDSGVRGAISVLSRYSAGGVDQYTVVVGQLLCAHFRLNSRAMVRLKDAIMNLKAVTTIGNMLHFGFGVDSIVRNLAATVEGGTLVALCAAATETFHSDQAANILWELVRSFDPPERRTPSPMQWKALLTACAGTLSETSFPRLVEHFMQLHSESNRLNLGRPTRDTSPELRGVSSPDSVAEALLAIGKVSTGDLVCVSVFGGPDAGWLAAVAQWIFDLRVAIFDVDGAQVHATSMHQHAQVQIHFTEPSSDPDTTTLSVSGQVCRLRDITELFHFDDNEFGTALVCSRVPWANALALTFGADFKRLMDLPRAVASALSAAGRIFAGVAKSHKPVVLDERRHCKTYYEDVVGRGFSRFATSLFPELAALTNLINDITINSLKEALDQYESSWALIKRGCECDICKLGAEEGMFEEKFCLVLLLETIIFIAHCMSGVSAPENLLPMRSGIEAQYRRQLKLHVSEKLQPRISTYGAAGAILEFSPGECEEWNIEESVAIPKLIHTIRLYTGRDIRSSDHEQVAISVAGIVVFLNSLVEGCLPIDPESAGRCTVMPGHVEMYGRLYHSLEDLSDFDLHGMDYRRRRRGGQPFDPLIDAAGVTELTNNFDSVTMIAQERPNAVKVGLSVHERHADPSVARSVILGPASLNERVLEATGIVECDGRSCERKYTVSSLLAGDECVKLIDGVGDCKVWLFCGNDLSRLVALTRMSDIQPMFYSIMQFGECLDCCVKAAQLSQYENAIIIARTRRMLGKRIRAEADEAKIGASGK